MELYSWRSYSIFEIIYIIEFSVHYTRQITAIIFDISRVQRVDLTCDIIKKVAPFVLRFEYLSLIGQCTGHVTRFL